MRRIVFGFLVALLALEFGARVIATQFPPAIRTTPWYASDSAWNVTAIAHHLRSLHALESPPSIVVAGSSSAGAGVDAAVMSRALGASTYNGWVPGGGIDSVRDVLVDVVGSVADPDVVVVALTARDLNDAESQRDANAALRASPGFEALSSDAVMTTVEDKGRRLSALVRYRGILSDPGELASAARGKARWRDSEIAPRGTLLRREPQSDVALDAYLAEERTATEGFDPTAVGATLTALIALLRDEGKQVVLAELPLADRYVDLFDEGRRDVEQTRVAMRRVARQAGIPFVDAAACGTWAEADFADPNHLGDAGRLKMTDCVVDAVSGL